MPHTPRMSTTQQIATGLLPSGALRSDIELLVDGNMEAATTAAWTPGGTAALTKEAGTRTGGSGTQVLRIARNGAANPAATQTILTNGSRYRAVGWARSDGNAGVQLWAQSVAIWVGTTSTSWQYFDFEFISTGPLLTMFSVTNTGTQYTEWDDVRVRKVL